MGYFVEAVSQLIDHWALPEFLAGSTSSRSSAVKSIESKGKQRLERMCQTSILEQHDEKYQLERVEPSVEMHALSVTAP